MNNINQLIGICGFIHSGKTAVAKVLNSEFNYHIINFSDSIKEIASLLFDWDLNLLQGNTKESKEFREKEDEFLTTSLGKTITPRNILQKIGTECFRKGLHSDIWIVCLKKKLMNLPDNSNVVIPDVRFKNEISFLKNLSNSKLWNIRRYENPVWWEEAIKKNLGEANTLSADIHPSEYSWIFDDSFYDEIIINDSNLEGLKKKVLNYF